MLLVLRRIILLSVLLALRWWVVSAHPAEASPEWVLAIEKLLGGLIALSVALVIDGIVRVFFWKGYLANVMGAKVPRLLPLTVSILIFGAALFHILQNQLGFSLGGALAASGFLAVIIGFALRSVILDLFSGLAISIDRSYAVGDWISVTSRDFEEPVYGLVTEIDWRTTRLMLEDGRSFIMPNSIGGVFTITNHSQPVGPKRLEVTIHLPHETPTERARKLLLGAAMKAIEGAEGLHASPAPSVLVTEVTTDGIEYQVRFYADIHRLSPSIARSILRTGLLEAVAGNDLRIPPAQIELSDPRDRKPQSRASVDAEAAIRQTRLFGSVLNEDELASLAAAATRRHFSSSHPMIEEGAEGSSLFILLSGAAVVQRRNGHDTAHALATLSTGDVVGEMSLLTGETRTASVIARSDLEALEISKQALAPILKKRPELAEDLSALLAQRAGEQADHDRLPTDDKAPAHAPAGIGARIRSFFSL
ncbi:cyclic nucleotide-binding domain-containing protein [Parvularcula marina]|uniref:cyclic nucleotide-binding domain-containing protein n=1 Tax=Parvularcula marina TaxID=2292771 RepID=UPI0035180FFD